jgi:hypothetical protein
MSAAPAEIARCLAEAKRRRRHVILAASGAITLGAAALCLLGGAAALHLGARAAATRGVTLPLAALSMVAGAAWLARALAAAAGTPEAVARTLTAGRPALRSDLVSAVQLLRQRPGLADSGAISLALLDAHVERTAAEAATIDLAAAIPAAGARRAGWVLLGVAAVHLVAFLAGGGALGRAWVRNLAGEPATAAAPSLDPITGDVELAYRYPAYTGRPAQTISGTGGEIRAPRGTEVSLKTRADRPVEAAELQVGERSVALAVSAGRDLTGTLLVLEGGSYRFRFRTRGGRTVAEGPPIPIVAEPDAFPTVRITAPVGEVEVQPDAVVPVGWQAEDDYGLEGLELVTRAPGGAEQRRPLRALTGLRHDSGRVDLALAPQRLGEGERLLYWLEVKDNDAVSGPKKGASATQTILVYSEAEHRRAAMEKARAAWEALVELLGDRLETWAGGPVATPARLPLAVALDVRTRALHERLRQVAAELDKEKAAPRELSTALRNVAAGLRTAEQRVTATRQVLARQLAARQPVEGLVAQARAFDRLLDEELEKGILYLEQLFDKARAEDLVRQAKDLAARRRDLQQTLERYRDAPTEKARQEALAQLRRLRERMQALMARMAETARGLHDEHMNAEALAELRKQQDLGTGLDAAEEALKRGDVAAALKAIDEMGAQLDQMMAGLQRASGRPDAAQAALMKEMLAFKARLEQVQAEQEQAAAETEAIQAAQRGRMAGALERGRQAAARLEELARSARGELKQAQPGTPPRGEQDLDAAQEATADLQRALAMKDLEAAQEMTQRALAPARRLASTLEEDAALSERFPGVGTRDPRALREAQRHAREAGRTLTEVGRELQKLQPDPRQALSPSDVKKLEALTRRQQGLERQAGELQQGLGKLMQQAPIFPPSASQQLGEVRGHMNQAAGELAQRNAPRGHGEQRAALDTLGRFKEGLEKLAKRGGGQAGGGFPFPFGGAGSSEGGEGETGDPTAEKVEIPGAEAHRIPEAFRRDLLEAMKQGAPERYRGEVQRYYEELVK